MAAASINKYISNNKGDRIKLQLVQMRTQDRCCIQKLTLFFIIYRFSFSLQFQARPFVLLQDESYVLLLIESYLTNYLYQIGLIILIYLLNLHYLTIHLHFNVKEFKLLV